MNNEAKEILGMFAQLLKTMNNDRNEALSNLELKIDNLETQLTAKTQSTFQTLWSTVETSFTETNSKVASNSTKIKDIETALEAEEEKQSLIDGHISALQEEVRKLRAALDDQDAYVRRESPILSGDAIPAVKANEDCKQLAREIIKKELNLPNNNQEILISTAHRMGAPPSPDSRKLDKRSIVVRFCQRDIKHQVYTAGRQKKVKDLYFNESLTKTRKEVHTAIRRIKKECGELVTGVSTHNGRVFMYHKPARNAPPTAKSLKTEINTMQHLEAFCIDFLKKPLQSFLSHFKSN